jgi:hypothetical protein
LDDEDSTDNDINEKWENIKINNHGSQIAAYKKG